jgi:ABC-type uncharacterized transport system substrate-binding protein
MTVCGNPLSRSLLGAKRTCPFALHMSANDPKRTSKPYQRFACNRYNNDVGNGARHEAPQGYAAQLAAFRQGLNEAGLVEGRDAVIEYRWADDQYDRLPGLAADLVRRRVAVIATIGGNAASLAARTATTTIPVVFHGSLDPVKAGFVASLNRPGGNATGVVTLNVDTGQKRLELIHEVVPAATTLGLLLNPANKVVTETQSKDLQAGARGLGLQLRVLNASTERDFEDVFASLKQMQVGGLVIGTDGFSLAGVNSWLL